MRPTKDQWAMQLALVTARRATCLRRAVGCVLLNERGHVIATGYNGVAAGQKHCNELVEKPVYHNDPRVKYDPQAQVWVFNGKETPSFGVRFLTGKGNFQCVGFEPSHPHACPGADSPSGTNLDACQAIHAEQNALLQCKDVYSIHTCYVTASPCVTCTKLLLNTGCQRIVFVEEYPQPAAKDLWVSSGRQWSQTSIETT